MLNRLRDVFASFQKHKVKYLVIGGVAAVLHGVPRATFDLDILIESIFQDRVRIDVQTSTPGLVFSDAWNNRETMEYQKQKFHVVSKADLVASKRASGRAVDLEDVRLLTLDDTE